MEAREIYPHSTTTMPKSLKSTLLHLNDEMKREAIYLLSRSLNHNTYDVEKGSKASYSMEFPKLPQDFKVSENIKQMGTKFPQDFDYEAVIEEMYQSFAK